MKKLVACLFVLMCTTIHVDAQNSKDVQKVRRELYKASKSELPQIRNL